MARRKDAVALFEVITATKRKQEADAAARQAAPQQPALRTPKWWFKNRSARPQQSDTIDLHSFTPAALPPAQYQQHPQLSPPPADESAGLLAQPSLVQRVASAPPAERVTIPEQRTHGGDPFGLDIPDAPARSRSSWMGFGRKKIAIDPDRREVTFRVRYGTAIVVGFALCVAIGLAYMSGRQRDSANAGPNRITSEDVRRGAINANVLDIRSGRNSADADNAPPTNDEDLARQASDRTSPDAPTAVTPKAASPIAFAPGTGIEKGLPRQNNLNYVIVQSYDNEKSAVEMVKALEAAGIPCTIERMLNGWSTNDNYYIVVGLHGFPKLKSSKEYNEYIRAIEIVGRRLAMNPKAKKFETPMPYKWKQQ